MTPDPDRGPVSPAEPGLVSSPIAWIGLGGNVGDVARTFDAALALLDDHPAITVAARSGVHRTAAVGERAGAAFANMAAGLETALESRELLGVLHEVELRFGRTRDVPWGPRTLDLDLLFRGDEAIDEPGLRVPHPAAWYRRFVLAPLVEIAPDLVHPERDLSIAELLERIDRRPLSLALVGGSGVGRQRLAAGLADRFAATDLAVGERFDEQSTVVAWLGPEEGAFESLPVASRLDVSRDPDPLTTLHNAIRSALG